MAEAVSRGQDPESPNTAQRLGMAEKEYLVVDLATLTIIEGKLLIAQRMKNKRRRMTMEHPSYREE